VNKVPHAKTKPDNSYPRHPHVAVGAIVFKNGKVLLVRRAKAPSEDLWAIPGGKVRLGESLKKAAEREIKEETSIVIRAREPVYTFDHIETDSHDRIRFHYVIVDLNADYVSGQPRPGDDALEARWISPAQLKDLNVSKKTLEVLAQLFNFGI
jgi:ADP-ribose pyrophosphatase